MRCGRLKYPGHDARREGAQHPAVQIAVVVRVVKFEHARELNPEPSADARAPEFQERVAPGVAPALARGLTVERLSANENIELDKDFFRVYSRHP